MDRRDGDPDGPRRGGDGPGAGDDEFLAGVAHELANAVAAVSGWAEIAEERARARGTDDDATRNVLEAARTAERIARAFLARMRGSVLGEQEPVVTLSAGELVRDLVRLLEPKARRAEVTLRASATDAFVRARRSDAITMVWNLLQNAVEAAPAGSTVLAAASREGGQVIITVRDHGAGIPEADLSRVFDDFFSTKATGTGLGLALVKRAATRAGGTVRAENAEGGGARFVLALPAAEADATQSARGARTTPRPSAAKRILVVDDDEGIRELMETVLRADGHHVTAAASGEAIPDDGARYDLAILDVGLGGARGDAVAAKLRARGLTERVVLASGATHPLEPEQEPDAWLPKPFDIAELRALVGRMLSSEP